MLFEGALPEGKEIPLVETLLDAGADVDFQRSPEDGKKGDTPPIGAAGILGMVRALPALAADHQQSRGPSRRYYVCRGQLWCKGQFTLTLLNATAQQAFSVSLKIPQAA